ncbi:MAG: hypothetical protein U0R50_06795 [Gaiellales bacterium]
MSAGSSSMQSRLLAAAGLMLLLGGLGAAIVLGRDPGRSEPTGTRTDTTKTPAKPRVKPPARIRVTAVGALDPEGDNRENDELAVLAVDGDASTSWRTERYTSFFKTGVGLVLDAGRVVSMKRVKLTTDTPGFTAELRGGATRDGPFRRLAAARVVQESTTVPLRDQRARFLVVWVTRIPNGSAADVSEVVLAGR